MAFENLPGRKRREGLTPRQEEFVELMLSDPSMTQTEAARLAGYAHPHVAGNKLAKRPEIRARLRGRVESVAMAADEMLARMADFARADITEFFDCFREEKLHDENGEECGVARLLDLEKVRGKRLGHLIKRLTPSRYGDIVELHDAKGALETLMKQAGMFTQQVRVTTEDVKRVEVMLAEPNKYSLEDLERAREELRSRATRGALPPPGV